MKESSAKKRAFAGQTTKPHIYKTKTGWRVTHHNGRGTPFFVKSFTSFQALYEWARH